MRCTTLVLSLLLTACGTSATVDPGRDSSALGPDASATPDATEPVPDGGAEAEGGLAADALALADAGDTEDAALAPDALPPDSSAAPDAALGLDAEAPADAGALEDGALEDASAAVDAAPVDTGFSPLDAGPWDAGAVSGTSCPTTGQGAIVASGTCNVFTAEESGLPGTGENATVPEYALGPTGTVQNALVVHIHSSLGSPARQIADPTQNFYNAAAQAGFHVLAITYRSNAVVGITCNNDPPCFERVRRTLVTGVAAAQAPRSLMNITVDEGILARIDAAIRYMAAAQPSGGWEQFIANPAGADAAQRIAWNKLIATGHSQGGGHAAFLAQLEPLRRVVQLSSTCDATGSAPAPWTAATRSWATSPRTRFVGFAAPTQFSGNTPSGGDTICPWHVAVWNNMGLDPANQHDDAATCGADAHGASIGCPTNFARWSTLFQ